MGFLLLWKKNLICPLFCFELKFLSRGLLVDACVPGILNECFAEASLTFLYIIIEEVEFNKNVKTPSLWSLALKLRLCVCGNEI